ncbi:hypothetical protein JW911_04185 [Candidatus Peregrinibacteria bacterium]|nr:hypothetical protein [Candidatus Peregrinibacteria bacterium]
MFDKTLTFPRERIVRIGVGFVLFFVIINLAVYFFLPSYKHNLRASEFFLDINICNFSDKDIDEISDLVKNTHQPKIFLLGDSITYGIGTDEKESISGYLRANKPDYAVFNLSVCGAKPLDFYLWINYLDKIDPGSQNIYLVQYNYKWFPFKDDTLENYISQKKTLYRFSEFLNPDIANNLKFNPGGFDYFKYHIQTFIPVVSNKDRLFALLFRERSKEDLMRHLFFGAKVKPSFEDKKKNFNCRIDYSSATWNAGTDFNYEIYLKTLAYINQNNINAVVYLPAYNSDLVSRCRDENFNLNIDHFIADAALFNVKAFDFTEKLSSEYFLDDMHLTQKGGSEFAQILSEKL